MGTSISTDQSITRGFDNLGKILSPDPNDVGKAQYYAASADAQRQNMYGAQQKQDALERLRANAASGKYHQNPDSLLADLFPAGSDYLGHAGSFLLAGNAAQPDAAPATIANYQLGAGQSIVNTKPGQDAALANVLADTRIKEDAATGRTHYSEDAATGRTAMTNTYGLTLQQQQAAAARDLEMQRERAAADAVTKKEAYDRSTPGAVSSAATGQPGYASPGDIIAHPELYQPPLSAADASLARGTAAGNKQPGPAIKALSEPQKARLDMDLTAELNRIAQTSGTTLDGLDPGLVSKMKGRATDIYMWTGDPTQAVHQAIAETYGSQPSTHGGARRLFGAYGVVPGGDIAPPLALDKSNAGGTATVGGAGGGVVGGGTGATVGSVFSGTAPPTPTEAIASRHNFVERQTGVPSWMMNGVLNNESGLADTGPVVGDGGAAHGRYGMHADALDDANRLLGRNYTTQDLERNPDIAAVTSGQYLGMLLHQFGNNPQLALAAYNMGPAAMAAVLHNAGGDPARALAALSPAVQGYVQRVMQNQPQGGPPGAPGAAPTGAVAQLQAALARVQGDPVATAQIMQRARQLGIPLAAR